MVSDNGIVIYIVEDDKLFSSLMKGLVEKLERDFQKVNSEMHLKPLIFSMPHHAEKELKSNPPDIVLLDYYLADESGKIVTCDAFLQKLMTFNSDTKVIIVSGQSQKETVDRLKEIGAAFYISKQPKTIHRIVPTLKMIIEKKLSN